MNVLALDLSLTGTGVAHCDGSVDRWSVKATGPQRLLLLRDRLVALLEAQIDLVVIEEYAFSRAAAHSHEVGEWGGVARLALHEAGQAWVAVNPSTLKRYATGRGNAKKPEVLAAAIRRLGYAGHDDNEADALWLRAMALDAYDHREVVVPAAQRAALAAVTWPALEVRA